MNRNDAMPDDDPKTDDAGDPADGDLIAFLDGELAGPEAARVEDRLALDPAARPRAAEVALALIALDGRMTTLHAADLLPRTIRRVA